MATSLPKPGDPDVLYVVDLMGYVFRAYHALPPMSTSSGEPTHAVYGVTQMLLSLVTTQRPHRFAVALDAPGPSFRKELYPAYKATRPAPPPDLREQIDRLEEVIAAYAIPCLVEPGFEADDLIAALVAKARAADLSVVVVSADKDLLQLVGPGVVMYDTMRERVYGREETVEKLGVPPERVCDYLALTGDSSDNIPGVPSVGPKTAASLLAEHASLEAIYEALDAIPKKGLRAKLAEHRADAFLSRELACLRADAPVSLDLDALRYGGADEEALRRLFVRLEFPRLLAQLSPAPAPSVMPVDHKLVQDAGELSRLCDAVRAAGELAIHTLAEGDDPRAAPVAGVALVCEQGAAAYVPFGHLYAGAPAQLGASEVCARIGALLADPSIRLRVSDTKREVALWARFGVELTNVGFDVMLASYLVDPERHGHSLEEVSESELRTPLETFDALTEKKKNRGHQRALSDVAIERARDFACARAHLAWRAEALLAPRLDEHGLQALLHDVEIPLARVLARMERTGVRVDTACLAELSARYGARIAALDGRARELAGPDLKIASPRSLETVLFDRLGLPVVKRTKTSRSTDHEVLEELAHLHELPKVILEHRMLTKLVGTYIDALPRQIHPETKRIHTRFNQAVAATGRMSSSEPNLQNIPIRTDEGRAIRSAFVAREGWQLMAADYSQIELRVLAHLSRDPELVDAFTRGEDVHVRTAKAVFGVEEVTREQRGQAKTVNYAVIYGQTQFALARNLGISKTEAKRYIDAFFERYAGVARFMDETVEKARSAGGVHTLLGRWRALPDIRSKNRGLRFAAERVARNTPIQGTAADLMKVAMVRIDAAMRERGLASAMVLTVHDELVFEVAPGEEDAMRALAKDRMEHVGELSVPLVVDVGLGRTWNDAH